MRRPALAFAVVLGLAAVLAAVAAQRAFGPAGPADAPPVTFVVPEGAGLRRVAADLARAGLVRNARAFEWLGRWHGAENRLRSGEYELRPGQSAAAILDAIRAGRVKTREISIPEGLTSVEIARRFEAAGLAERDAFLQVVNDPASPERLGVEGPGLEGYLFPETYHLARGLPAAQVVGTLVAQFRSVWDSLTAEEGARSLGMRRTVILASIVEKETGVPEERPLIAAVFLNRLRLGMRLETDPSVIYGIPDFDGNLTRSHLEDEANPYNTYRFGGLPPGPIANPGAAALRAVLQPAESDVLYFVSRNDGTHVFSRSYREHRSQVRRFQMRRGGRGGG
jgi:peptidoglycan lytic transglycosylase G